MTLFKKTKGSGVRAGRAQAVITVNTDEVKAIPAEAKRSIVEFSNSVVAVSRKAAASVLTRGANLLTKGEADGQ